MILIFLNRLPWQFHAKKQRLDIKSPFWESRRYKEAQEAKAAQAAKAAEEAAKAKPTEEEEGPSTPPGSSLDLMVSTGRRCFGELNQPGGCLSWICLLVRLSWMWKMKAWFKAEQGLLRICVVFKPRASCLLSGFPCFQKKLSGPCSLFRSVLLRIARNTSFFLEGKMGVWAF